MKLTYTNRLGLVGLIFLVPYWISILDSEKPWYATAILITVYMISFMMFVWDSHDEK